MYSCCTGNHCFTSASLIVAFPSQSPLKAERMSDSLLPLWYCSKMYSANSSKLRVPLPSKSRFLNSASLSSSFKTMPMAINPSWNSLTLSLPLLSLSKASNASLISLACSADISLLPLRAWMWAVLMSTALFKFFSHSPYTSRQLKIVLLVKGLTKISAATWLSLALSTASIKGGASALNVVIISSSFSACFSAVTLILLVRLLTTLEVSLQYSMSLAEDSAKAFLMASLLLWEASACPRSAKRFESDSWRVL
mmetsp:Transcript_24763/g.46554  ORF Transcript_24763/g.46554 Transcript_24763/m.46554 type:complete len:253 (-) Transcript_24763:1788-2546(-)